MLSLGSEIYTAVLPSGENAGAISLDGATVESQAIIEVVPSGRTRLISRPISVLRDRANIPSGAAETGEEGLLRVNARTVRTFGAFGTGD